jgi:phosphonate metabolism protein PhnN/1,5-bisphosphokinase (PRPP-forming)
MARGTLVLVVGPSGVGKDSIIAGAAQRLGGDPRYLFPRRLITRPETAGGEPHIALSPAAFAARRDAGGLLLQWRAHGLDYGLPVSLEAELAAGRCVVANVSRTMVAEARRGFAPVAVVAISAAPETLAARLAGRGREDAAEIERRLQRAVPADPPDVTIDNDGTLGEAVDRFVATLRGLAGQPQSG